MAGIGVATAPEVIPAPRRFAIRPRMVRTLLWLRWRLVLRRLGSSVGAIIGLVLSAIFFLVFGLSLGAATWAGYALLPFNEAFALLFLVLTGIYALWAALPLMQYTLNEGLDVTKLVLYPLTRPELMASLVITTLFDVSVILLFLIFAGVVLGFANTWPQAIALIGVMILTFIHTIAISQLLLSALMGLLRSRRFRDLSIIFATVFGLSCSLISQIFARTAATSATFGSSNIFEQILKVDYGSILQFFPPGMAARAVAAIAIGDTLPAIGWTALLAVTIVPVLWAWSAILERGLASPEQGAARVKRRVNQRVAARDAELTSGTAPIAASGRQWSLIPAASLAIAGKEWRYYWRDPQYKRLFFSSLYIIGIILLSSFGVGNSGASLRSGSPLVILAAVFLVQSLTTTIFGYEAASLTTLAIFPIRGVHLFFGKNLAAFSIGLAEAAILLLLQGFVTGHWETLPTYSITTIAAMFVAMGPGNVLAVFFPLRVARAGLGRNQLDSGTNFVTALLSALAYFATLLLFLPIAAAVILPSLLNHPEWLYLALPASLLYGIGIYAGGLAIAAGQYYPRLTKIMRVVVKE